MIANGNSASTVYNEKPWGMPTEGMYPPNQALGPDRSNPERITGDRLVANLLAQAPAPQVQLFRPRYGYRTDAIGFTDIMNVDLMFRPPNVGAWYSGGPAETNSGYSNFQATFGNL